MSAVGLVESISRRVIGLAAASAVFATLALAARAVEHETPEDMPPGKGRDETFYACTACHGTLIIRQQGMSRDRWEQTFDYMIERHGMPEIDKDDRALVIEYLAGAFPPRRQAPVNPFLRQ